MNYVEYLEGDLGIPHEPAEDDSEAVYEELFLERLHDDQEHFGDLEAENMFRVWRAKRLGIPVVDDETCLELPHAS